MKIELACEPPVRKVNPSGTFTGSHKIK
jgi:hypothetical protein